MIDWISAPAGPLRGEIRVPGDKSISHRAIMFAALAEGTSRITGFLEGEDTRATARAFAQMGVRMTEEGDRITLDAGRIDWPLAPYEMVKTMRASILALGPLLARCLEARVSLPGGWGIGHRPVDLLIHLFEEMHRAAKETGVVATGDSVVCTAGFPLGKAGASNLIKVEIVP